MNFRLLGKSGLKRFLIVPLLSTFALLSPIVTLAQQPTTMSANSVAKLPFSPGLELGDILYVSGHLGVDPAVGKAPDDPEEEARQVLHSVELTLKEAGMSVDDLVYVEIYCTDLKLYGAFNKAYASTLKSPYPARDFIGVKDLLFGAHFEVMGIAGPHPGGRLRMTRRLLWRIGALFLLQAHRARMDFGANERGSSFRS